VNLILLSLGNPPAMIKAEPQRRIAYLVALERASVQSDLEPFEQVVAEAFSECLERGARSFCCE
jgi:hypothetical protein